MTCVKRQDAHGPDSINLHANRQEAPLLTLAHRRQVEGTDNSAAHFRLGALLKLSYGIELKVYDAVIRSLLPCDYLSYYYLYLPYSYAVPALVLPAPAPVLALVLPAPASHSLPP